MSRQAEYNRVFMAMAREMASLSKDPNTKVGCVLVSPDRRTLSTGFNGFPAGYVETAEQWADRASTDKLCKRTLVRHAEDNALGNCPVRPKGWTAFVTHQPCIHCAGALGHAGVIAIFWEQAIKPEYHPELAEQYCREAGILYQCVKS